MMIRSRCWVALSLFLSLSGSVHADVRESANRPRPVRGSLAYSDGNHRQMAHWGGAVKVDSVPSHVTARTNAGKNQPKPPKGEPISENFGVSSNREVDLDAIEVAEPKMGKAAKKIDKKGQSSTGTSTGECDDPSDPDCLDCDDASDPRCQSQASEVPSTSVPTAETSPPSDAQIVDTGRSGANSEGTAANWKQNGRKYGFAKRNTTATPTPAPASASTSAPRSTTTMHRSLTPFKLGYYLTTKLYEDDLDDGDYAELSDHTELFLTQYFTSYFAEEPTEFHDTVVSLQKTDNPLVVRLYITLNFIVPGNVPTMSNLFDRIKEAFSGQHAREYVALLNEMGLGNPFRNAGSVILVNDVPVTVTDTQPEGNDEPSFKDNTAEFLSVVISSVVLFLVVLGLIWACGKHRRLREEPINQTSVEDVEQQDLAHLRKQSLNNSKSRGANDANTRAYIQTIRRRYSDDGASKTDRDDVSIDEMDDDEQTESKSNSQTLAELREAMHMLDALSASGIEKSEPTYPSPASNSNKSDEDDKGNLNDKKQQQQQQQQLQQQHRSSGNVQNKKEYMDYLDFQSSYDDEDDLRT